ncbi:GntR family transcriptional regulator [Streptomyces sp. NPDC058989]|uniref:GntR family transcriptional regulator n=1 Tax=Streptomyces sp. NPDC058989 TaxID=3346686 RepID=UPI0036873041
MTLPLEDDPRPPYIQAAEVLRRQIKAGTLKPGDKLPSARELQDRYGIASSTVQNALRLLKSEGLVYSVQGRGSFVRNGPIAATDEPTTAAPADEAPVQEPEAAEEIELAPSPMRSAEFNTLAQGIIDLTRQVESLRKLLTGQPQQAPQEPEK